jgi:hypothetical protein
MELSTFMWLWLPAATALCWDSATRANCKKDLRLTSFVWCDRDWTHECVFLLGAYAVPLSAGILTHMRARFPELLAEPTVDISWKTKNDALVLLRWHIDNCVAQGTTSGLEVSK